MKSKWAITASLSAISIVLCSFDSLWCKERELMLFMDIPVVTAAKFEQPISEAPATIDVITDKEIDALGFRTLADALKIIPGMDVMSMIYITYMSARGLNGRRSSNSTLCLIDGHPFNEVTRGTAEPLAISLANVKRIEVIRGPGSALYGANAFAGVINIITKGGADVNGFQVSQGGGNYSLQKQTVLAGREANGVSTFFSFDHFKADSVAGQAINRNDDREDTTAFAKVTAPHWALSFNRYRGDLGMPGTTTTSTPDFRAGMISNFVSADYNSDTAADTSFKVLSHVLDTHQKVHETMGPVEADSRQIGVEGQVNTRVASWCSITGGMEIKQDSNDSEILGGQKQINTEALYAQGELRAWDWLIFTLGGRYDMPSAYDNVFSPRANVTFKFTEDTVAKASYGKAFRAPNFFELYVDTEWDRPEDPLFRAYRILGNKDLKPETIESVETGVSHSFSPRLQCALNLFNINTYNTITYETTLYYSTRYHGLGGQMFHVNKNRTETRGGELSLKWQIVKGLETSLSYAYQDAFDRDRNMELSLAPQQKFNAIFFVQPVDRLRWNTFVRYVGRKTDYFASAVDVAPYKTVDTRAILDIYPGLQFALSVCNVFDERYAELDAVPISGRTVIAELSYKFGG